MDTLREQLEEEDGGAPGLSISGLRSSGQMSTFFVTWILEVEMSFFRNVSGLSPREVRVSNSVIWEVLKVETATPPNQKERFVVVQTSEPGMDAS